MNRSDRTHPNFAPMDPHAAGRKLAGYGATLSALGKLKPGECLVYHRGDCPRCAGAFAAANDAYEQGTVTLTQRRQDGVLEYLVTRRRRRG